MFAFALYDEREDFLWIARDRVGIKPLYYRFQNKSFTFSSELTGLAKCLKSKISNNSIVHYLGYSYISSPNTIYEDIYKLEPGEEITISKGDFKKNKYW